MNKVSTEAELLSQLQKSERIILMECKRTAMVMARYLKRKGLLERVTDVYASSKSKKKRSYLGIPSKRLAKVEDLPEAAYVMVEVPKHLDDSALQELENRGLTEAIILDYDLFAEISKEENPHLDFLCVGFTKCGTTSLNNAFRMHEDLYMPKGKETFYLHWRHHYQDAPAKFQQKYFSDIPQGKLLGNVEPSYHVSARGVYECFGKDIKLLFMVREPSSATFSYYKMLMRRPRKMDYVEYYKEHKKYSVEIFTDFIEDKIFSEKVDRFQYDRWIADYLKYFSKDQIKIIVFEELLRDTKRIMDEIQDFIGVKDKKVYEELPHSNDGSGVSRGYVSAYINYRYYMSIRNRKENSQFTYKQKKFFEFAKWAQKYTTVENKEKMTPEQKARLQEFYRPSVERLSELLGRDVGKIWYQ